MMSSFFLSSIAVDETSMLSPEEAENMIPVSKRYVMQEIELK